MLKIFLVKLSWISKYFFLTVNVSISFESRKISFDNSFKLSSLISIVFGKCEWFLKLENEFKIGMKSKQKDLFQLTLTSDEVSIRKLKSPNIAIGISIPKNLLIV